MDSADMLEVLKRLAAREKERLKLIDDPNGYREVDSLGSRRRREEREKKSAE